MAGVRVSNVHPPHPSFSLTARPPSAAPGALGEAPAVCVGEVCDLASEYDRENGDHGWTRSLRFASDPDGTLYADTFPVTDWTGSPFGF